MTPLLASQSSPLGTLLGQLQALFNPPDATHAMDRDDVALIRASVAAAVHVIVADGEADEVEFAVAADGLQSRIDLDGALEPDALSDMLHAAAVRARTRSGRIENLRADSSLAERPMRERRSVFLLAADVADVEGISGVEERALAEIAAALDVNRTALCDHRAGLHAAG